MKMKILPSTENDIPDLVDLVQTCYRGESSRLGWTNQADLIDGNRATPQMLKDDMSKPGALILKGVDDTGKIIGCVYTQLQEKKLYVGMLCVLPELQRAGLGKMLMNATDELAKENNCTSAIMTVVTKRTELIQYYERRGYRNTGVTMPYPDEPYGKPKMPLEFVYLEKDY